MNHTVPIRIQANYLPQVRKFTIQVNAPGIHNVEIMTVAHFLRFARSDGPFKIGGATLEFNSEIPAGEERAMATLQSLRDYLRKVADSYVEAKYKRTRDKGNHSKSP
jgi:hypothetical protein